MRWIGSALSYFGLYLVYIGSIGSEEYRLFHEINWGKFFIYAIFGGIVAMIGESITKEKNEDEEASGDKRAEDILKKIKGNGPPFSLFLRPFDSTAKFKVDFDQSLFSWEQYDRPGADTLERHLADAVEETAKLIGLGDRGDLKYGPGMAGLMDDWQRVIDDAMNFAVYIFLIPSANPGTLWEIGIAKQNDRLSKTIFIMPSTCYPFTVENPEKVAANWVVTRDACKQAHNIDIPDYEARGGVFMVKEGAPSRLVNFTGYGPHKLAKIINKVISKY